ncbi:MAG: twin-arginine translocase TatA/TatE family subunit [Tepidiformaceae bacterium]
MPIGAPELAIIAVVLVLLFGVGKISGLGKELGGSIKEFRKAVKDEDDPKKNVTTVQVEAPPVQGAPPVVTVTPPPTSASEKKNIF